MEIIYLGHSSFLLKNKHIRVVCDPFSKKSTGFNPVKTKADVVTMSHDHFDHNDLAMVEGDYRVFNGPGEYEVHGVSLTGMKSYHDNKEGKELGKNIIFIIDVSEIRIVHLGDLGHKLSEHQLDKLDGVDVLMVPVGGETSISPKTAVEVVKQINPSIVIPMHYKTKEHTGKNFQNKVEIGEFLKEIDLEPRKEKKLSLKKLGLPEETELVLLAKYG